MPNRELYTALYTKYAPELSPEELEEKLDYALKQDSNDFIGQFYQKYTGQGPTQEQSQEINRVIDDYIYTNYHKRYTISTSNLYHL